MLVHRDASAVKDTIVAINSIFQSIKQSVDLFDAEKSKVRTIAYCSYRDFFLGHSPNENTKQLYIQMCYLKFQNSYAICDLGLSITKRLASREEDFQGLIASVPLPAMIYKPCQKEEGNDSMVSYPAQKQVSFL